MTTMIAVANGKGIAKTTTCLSLGISLAEQGQRVMLVDLDHRAHLTTALGVEPEKLRRTVGDALLSQSALFTSSRETNVIGLDLAPANRELIVLDKFLHQRQGHEYWLKTRLGHARRELYDFVLIDCPPNFETLTVNALTVADQIIILVQCEYYSVQSLHRTLKMIDLMRYRTNPRLAYRLLVTMFDRRDKAHRVLLEYLRVRFSQSLFQTIVQLDAQMPERPVLALPIAKCASQTEASREYRTLAQELTAGLPSDAEQTGEADETELGAHFSDPRETFVRLVERYINIKLQERWNGADALGVTQLDGADKFGYWAARDWKELEPLVGRAIQYRLSLRQNRATTA